MKPIEREMLAELLKEASEILEEFEILSEEKPFNLPETYRYALKDELYGYALMLRDQEI